MKRIKKIASLILAMSMVLAMSVTVFAADNKEYVITIKPQSDTADTATHVYQAYQVFAGDLADVDGQKVLSNIIWGSGVDGDAILTALKAETTFNSVFNECDTAAEVAEALSGEVFESSDVSKATLTDTFATIVSKHLSQDYAISGNDDTENLAAIRVNGAGYYLVKDMNTSLSDQEDAAYTRILLEVVGDATVNVKSEVPSGDKEVYVDADTTDDANNAAIGSHVSYEITSKVPNYVGYDYYYFVMNDTLSKGLTFDGVNTIAVTVNGAELTRGSDYYVYTENVDPYTFRLAFANIKEYTIGDEIVVTYSATVNGEAVIGTTGNPNTWNLQYSNNPNETYGGTQDSSRPGLPANESGTVLGQTPDEKTLTFVTELDIIKYANEVDQNELTRNLLAGAEFTLTGVSNQVVLKDVVYYEVDASGDFYLLTDGTYTKEAPQGTEYVEIGVGTVDTEKGYLKASNGTYYIPTDIAEYNGATIYKLVRGTAEKYVDVNTKYNEVKAQEKSSIPVKVSMELTTGEDGKISFKGLGEGEYTLTETVTPKGFNTIDPIDFKIVFTAPDRGVVTGQETCMWDIESNDLEYTEGGNDQSVGGVFAANIINKSGSLLPSTGGIGTTIFYVVGGLLVAGAGILLVTKKRMSARR